MVTKPCIPKGTRDFSPVEMAKRNYIFDTIREVFRLYGFQQIETPAMESLSTLMGKYGDEGDKLLFKIQNSGDYFSGLTDEELLSRNAAKLACKFCEKGLRYDLTVPFARYVVMHRDEITFPFKRFQIQPVWRADRPQKGRYREFYQCDADVVGSDSLLNEVELVQMLDTVFRKFGIRVAIKINNRKILSGIAERSGENSRHHRSHRQTRQNRIGKRQRRIGIERHPSGSHRQAPAYHPAERDEPRKARHPEANARFERNGNEGHRGKRIYPEHDCRTGHPLGSGTRPHFGARPELLHGSHLRSESTHVQIGSISGGGRYDNLTGVFGLPGVSGVGISFGADRIYDVLNQLDLYPKEASASTQLLFVNFGAAESAYVLPVLAKARQAGIRAEIFPDASKMKKQMSYANAKAIPFVAIAGENEMQEGKLTLKNMATGEQTLVTPDELIEAVKR